MKKQILSMAALAMIFTACENTIEDTQNIVREIPADNAEIDLDFKIVDNPSKSNANFRLVNRPVNFKSTKEFGRSMKRNESIDYAKDSFYWELVADIEPYQLDGETLSATHVAFGKRSDVVYVSYNKRGKDHKGAVQIIDFMNPSQPFVSSSVEFPNSDVNALQADVFRRRQKPIVYFALSDSKKGAALAAFETENKMFTGVSKTKGLSSALSGVSASANGVAVTKKHIYVTGGKTYGGVVQFNKDLEILDSDEYSNAKYTAVNGFRKCVSKMATIITGDESKIKVYDVNGDDNLGQPITYDIPAVLHQEVNTTYRGKSNINFGKNKVHLFIAAGKDGVMNMDTETGEIINRTTPNMITNGNTNGVIARGKYVYMANGADGIAVAHYPKNPGDEIVPMFTWDLDEINESANFIKVRDGYLFVAKGNGGLKILKKQKVTSGLSEKVNFVFQD